MEELALSNNQLSGHLPSSIDSGLPNLEKLFLNGNNFRGTIPKSFSNVSKLFVLNLGSNLISGIGKLSNLTALKLGNNQLTKSIPIEIGKLRQLQVLYLDGNRLQGSIPSEICNLRNLGALQLSDNKFFGSVPACLGDITSLRFLHLNSNNLTSTIPSSLWNLKDILDLNLSNNSLIGNLPLDIGNLRAVTYIDLAWNELSGEIPSSFGNLQTLINFSIAHNKLKGHIPESFGNLISLELLELSSNNLSGAIPKSLEKLRYLKYFNVSFNRLDGEIPTEGAFANFSAESFIGNGQLCGAPRLQVPLCKTGNLSALESLLVDNCRIKGSIPYEVGSLSNLTTLRIRNNDLTGSIPTAVGKMRKLQVLSFECNRLQGSIPNEVCHLRNLGELYFGGNKLFGPIPTCLGDITSLRVLYLNSNNLTSTIPSSLWSLKNFNMQQTDLKKAIYLVQEVNLTETVSVLGPTSLAVVETVVDDRVSARGRKMLVGRRRLGVVACWRENEELNKVNLTETVSVLGPTSLAVVETVVDDGVPAGGRKMLALDLTPAFSPGSDPPGEPTGPLSVASLRAKATTKKKNPRERAQTERRLTMTISLGRASSRGAIDYSKSCEMNNKVSCVFLEEAINRNVELNFLNIWKLKHGVPISVEGFDQQKIRGGVDLAHKSGSED
ncbi:hypothetical protein Q3G72_001571 [Acer saccharum]|nr:hypothetical protein Q3G72_001571 [Acer saccharum]